MAALPAPPDYTRSELAILAADAADRRAALSAASVLLSFQPASDAFGHREHHAPSVHQWLEAADAAYHWLGDRDTLRATSISLIASTPEKEGTEMTTSLNLQDDQDVSFTLSGSDDKGIQVPAPADSWTWSSDDTAGAIITIAVSDDTTSATVSAVAPGTATVSVSGATSGLQGAEAVIVSAGPAVTIDLVPGTPEQESGV